jgi:multiple sugar transport system ATP-binding protein
VVVGIRPEDVDDASLQSDVPADRRLRGDVTLLESLGAEIVAHLRVRARPALSEDAKELAADAGRSLGDDGGSEEARLVARFGPRSKAAAGSSVELAVDTRSLHFFDPETGLGIYDRE